MIVIAGFAMHAASSSDRAAPPAKPPATAPADDQKVPGTQKSMKGWELYIWEKDNQTFCSLLPGTNELKSNDQINKAAVKGTEVLRAKLADLKPGQYITIRGRQHGDPAPKKTAEEIQTYSTKLGLEVHIP